MYRLIVAVHSVVVIVTYVSSDKKTDPPNDKEIDPLPAIILNKFIFTVPDKIFYTILQIYVIPLWDLYLV